MSLRSTRSIEDDTRRAVYEYVECHGAASLAELARSIRVEDTPTQSKPARSGRYTEEVLLPHEELRSAIEELKRDGHLVETGGKLRLALGGALTEHELEGATVTIRPAREEDRGELVAAMRTVANEGTYIVAENVAERLEREPALVRANEECSRAFFVAVLERDAAETAAEPGHDEHEPEHEADEPDRDGSESGPIVGWLHLDAPELPSLCHTAELTVGVLPDHRRDGIGSALLEYGLEWADGEYRKLYQHLPGTNERAIAFLEENGWTREGEREGHYRIDGEFVDEIQLAIWL